jgi:hypothetical protein
MTKTQLRLRCKSGFGTRPRKTSCGSETKKISHLKTKRVKKLIRNGKRSQNFPFQKLDRWKTMIRFNGLGIIGRAGEWLGMAGRSPSPRERKEGEILRTIRPKPLRRSTKRDLLARATLPRLQGRVKAEVRVRVGSKKDDCLFTHSLAYSFNSIFFS